MTACLPAYMYMQSCCVALNLPEGLFDKIYISEYIPIQINQSATNQHSNKGWAKRNAEGHFHG